MQRKRRIPWIPVEGLRGKILSDTRTLEVISTSNDLVLEEHINSNYVYIPLGRSLNDSSFLSELIGLVDYFAREFIYP